MPCAALAGGASDSPRGQRILALNPDGALNIDETFNLAQKKGVQMLSMSENGATTWKVATMVE
jgi:hypothetical protein